MIRRLRSLILFTGLFAASTALLQSAEQASLFSSNANWNLLEGRAEASMPISGWRTVDFDDSAFTNAPAPFTASANFNYGTPLNPTDYTCIFLRRAFEITNVAQVARLVFSANYDDGIIVWINGSELLRLNVPGLPNTEVLYTTLASGDHDATGFTAFELPDPATYLVTGSNIVAVQLFNSSSDSADLVFDGALDAELRDIDPPVIVSVAPPAGPVGNLTQITVQFSEPVRGVDANDLLVNGAPATSLAGLNNTYTFAFPRPSPDGGTVHVGWSPTNGIMDEAGNLFDGTAPEATWDYIVPDILAPTVTVLNPAPGSTVNPLTQVMVTFSEPVTNVNAGDLLINGKPARAVTALPNSVYRFDFDRARNGKAQLAWANGHGITDRSGNPFGGGSWSYNVDGQPYSILVHPASNTVFISFSNRFTTGVCTVESREGNRWVPIKNFFTTQRLDQITVPLPTNNYSQLRLRGLDISPGNAFTHLAQAYGNIHTIAGLGTVPPGVNGWRPEYEGAYATNVNLSNPRFAMADDDGNIFVVEKDGHAVVKITPDGRLHTVIGQHFPTNNGDFVAQTNSALRSPSGLWVIGNKVFVLDTGNSRIQVLTPNKLVSTIIADLAGIDAKGSGLWLSQDNQGTPDEAFYGSGTNLMHWTIKNGIETNSTEFLEAANVIVSPQGRTVVADPRDNRVWRVRGNGHKEVIAGTGFPNGRMAGDADKVALPGVRNIWYLPIGGYLMALDEGARVWYADSDDNAVPFVFGKPGVHTGDGKWFRAGGHQPKVGNVLSVTLTPSGDMILVEGSGIIRKIDFLRHTP